MGHNNEPPNPDWTLNEILSAVVRIADAVEKMASERSADAEIDRLRAEYAESEASRAFLEAKLAELHLHMREPRHHRFMHGPEGNEAECAFVIVDNGAAHHCGRALAGHAGADFDLPF